jgi:biotin synthase
MLDVDEVVAAARHAKDAGATRFCVGAAWRQVRSGSEFDSVLAMVRGIKQLGMQACCTLGMLQPEHARQLRDAGLDFYNHNVDTSETHYETVISTRSRAERFRTLQHVRDAGLQVCSGGIIGMGESRRDRCAMLVDLCRLSPQPESVPINVLVPAPGTPLESMPPVDPMELCRVVALARILMPRATVRLSAGRRGLPREAQLLCLYAGANSIFFGDKLLTTENADSDSDLRMLHDAGIATV